MLNGLMFKHWERFHFSITLFGCMESFILVDLWPSNLAILRAKYHSGCLLEKRTRRVWSRLWWGVNNGWGYCDPPYVSRSCQLCSRVVSVNLLRTVTRDRQLSEPITIIWSTAVIACNEDQTQDNVWVQATSDWFCISLTEKGATVFFCQQN